MENNRILREAFFNLKTLGYYGTFEEFLELSSGIDTQSQISLDSIMTDIRSEALIREVPNNFSSNRFDDWKLIVDRFLTDGDTFFLLTGYGAQGDRFFLKQTASSAFFHALISSGILGTMFWALALAVLLINIFKLLNLKLKKNDYHYYLMLIVVLFARSVLETSFSVFGIDFIILISCSVLIIKNNENKPALSN